MKFGSLYKMIITYLESKDSRGISGKGLITSLVIKAKSIANKYKSSRYSIVNISMKDLSNIIRDFEKLPYKGYDRKIPKHEPTNSYF